MRKGQHEIIRYAKWETKNWENKKKMNVKIIKND